MKNQHFLTNSPDIKDIEKSLKLTESLYVSSILQGQPNTGKKTFIASLFPKYIFINANDKDILQQALKRNEKIVIYNYEKIQYTNDIKFDNKKIIAISNEIKNTIHIENNFAFTYNMPSLKNRPEDIKTLSNMYIKDIKNTLMITNNTEINTSKLDISKNNKSLKADIFKTVITSNLDKSEIEDILFKYLQNNISSQNGYKENLSIFEKPLITAGLKKYKSQSKLSIALGINRNTLRKKINELNIN